MTVWVRRGVALAVILTAAFITIHPNFDLVDGVLHTSHDQSLAGAVVAALVHAADELSQAVHSSPEVFRQPDQGGVDSLDLFCVRLC